MAKLLNTIIDGFISGKNFVSGALGAGWRIWNSNGKSKAEFDDLVIRNTMTVFELLISKIRAVKGSLGITQASGKVKSVREDDTNFYLEIEDEMSFVGNDIVRCMEFSGNLRSYWIIVSAVTGNEITVLKSEFNGVVPLAGDELVQFGNTTDPRRQSAVYLHADENAQPAIDVLFGINSKTFDGRTRVRIGGDIPGTDGLKGFYCENGMLKGVNETGELMYCLYPDGTAYLGAGSAVFRPDRSGYIAGGAISWHWDTSGNKFVCDMGDTILQWGNLSEEVRENLKGEKGDSGTDANLLPWVEDWNTNKLQMGDEYLVSPRIFSGRKNADNSLTGVALGRDVITVTENGVAKQKTGLFGVKNNQLTFSVDSETGDAMYRGQLNVNDNFKVNSDGTMTAKGVDISGKITAFSGQIAGFKIEGSYLTNVGYNNDATLIFKNQIYNTYAAIGGNTLAASTGLKALLKIQNHEINEYLTNYGAIFSVKNANENIALCIESGDLLLENDAMISGFGLKVRHVTTNYTIQDGDSFIICRNSSAIILKMPFGPYDGRVVWVRKEGAGRVTLHGNGKKIYTDVDNDTRNLDTIGGLSFLIYNGFEWSYNFHKW